MWISVDKIINFTGVKPKHLNLEKDDDAKLEEIIGDWILQSQDLINMYTNRNYPDDNVRPAIQNICTRLTANMVTLAIQRRDSPIVKVNEWTINNVPSDIFTDDLKNDLKPYIKDSSNDRDSIGVLAITGSDD